MCTQIYTADIQQEREYRLAEVVRYTEAKEDIVRTVYLQEVAMASGAFL